jgi:glycosyltransferase involved in cell wall biosynthesis
MARPAVSIVTPSFENASFLPDACLSVSSQTDLDVEHIVIDGGSRDGTVEFLESQDDVRWVSEPDEGQSDAINKGFGLAEGNVVAWLNADDFYLEGALSRVLKVFEERPGVDVVFGDCVFIDEHARLLRGKSEHPARRNVLLYHGCYIPSTSTFFRRRILEAGDLELDGSLAYVMDTNLFLGLVTKGYEFLHVPEYLAAFRWHGGNQSLDVDSSRLEKRAVQSRYSSHSAMGYSILAAAYRVRHIAEKAVAGSYGRDLRTRKAAGTDMRWWPDPDEAEDVR